MRYFLENPELTQIDPVDLERIERKIITVYKRIPTFADIKAARAKQDQIDAKASVPDETCEHQPKRV